jgi:hypothetical protein
MLIEPSDFGGEYRLFNANNLDPDTIRAIDQAQEELARDLFPIGHSFIISNSPSDPPNLGLRVLGLHKLFIPWVFLRLELGILGAGVKRTSDVPGRSRFASGAFFAIARHYRSFVRYDWPEFESYIRATATSPSVLSVPVIVSQIIAPNMEIEVEGGGRHFVVASATGLLTISPDLPAGVTNLRFRQLSLYVDKNWNYL